MSETKEKKSVTGLDQAPNRQAAEYDIVATLLEAAKYKEDQERFTEIEMYREGQYLFTIQLRPLSDKDVRFARKKATIYAPNPNGKKLPPIEKDFDETAFRNWMIYLATTEADQQRVWGNPAVVKALGVKYPCETIEEILTFKEKNWLFMKVKELNDLDDDDMTEDSDSESGDDEESMDTVEYAKN